MLDYSEGKIYKLVNDINDKIYIGSTCKLLCNRMAGHRSDAKRGCTTPVYREMRKVGIENFKIVLIENFSCEIKSELEKREFHIMRRYIRREFKLLNSSIEIGKMSNESKRKMSGLHSIHFKRGCMCRESVKYPVWRFSWQEDGKKRSKSFSVKKYGEKGARRLAEKFRDEIYPLETSK